MDDLLAGADAVILSPPLPPVEDVRPGLIRCDVSAFGADGTDGLPDDANEAILQALGGVMSTTGSENGRPNSSARRWWSSSPAPSARSPLPRR